MNKNNLALILACLALGISMFAFFRSSTPVSASVTAADSTEMEPEELEVAILMQRFQWNVNKLYFAGMAGNKPLAGFYLHELEESMEELAEHPIEENGQRLDDLVRAWGLAPLEKLEESLEKTDPAGFKLAYSDFIQNCNGCHLSSGHPYLRIVLPTTPVMDNQDFNP